MAERSISHLWSAVVLVVALGLGARMVWQAWKRS